MWDLAEGEPTHEEANVDELKKRVLPKVVGGLNEYLAKLQVDRIKQAEIKTKYGVRSLDKLSLDLDGELIELYGRKEKGENVDIVIRNKEDQKKRYDSSKRELEDLIRKESSLTMSMPSFVGIVRVLPTSQVQDAMKRDEEVERLGMEVVMAFERDAGRVLEDVSKENLGFDIRSKSKDGKARYIEVKARAGVGAVALTQNEWFKAQRLADDYYLYVVWNVRKDPKASPLVILNPAANLVVDEKVEIVRYIVPPDEIQKKAS